MATRQPSRREGVQARRSLKRSIIRWQAASSPISMYSGSQGREEIGPVAFRSGQDRDRRAATFCIGAKPAHDVAIRPTDDRRKSDQMMENVFGVHGMPEAR
jgi:hypothetical protein